MIRAARSIFVFGLLSLVFTFLVFATSNVASAQSENPTISPSPIVQTNPNTTPNTNPDVPKNLHNWTQNVMIEVMLSLTCQLVGIDPTQPNGQCLGVDQKTGKIGFLPAGNMEKGEIGGAIGGMNNMITMLYTPPLRTSDYFQYLAQNFGVVKSAHAQTGTGFDSLKPLQKLWAAFRNIVYLIFVIVFVVIGLAIMLRIKIDPRTVMTIQNQIPKIIIGILLVTFSFAIAGFLVDMMWVMTYLVFGIIADANVVALGSIKELSPLALQDKSPLDAAMGYGQLSSMVHDVAWDSTKIIRDMLGIKESSDVINPLASITGIVSFLLNLLPGVPDLDTGTPVNFFINLVSVVGSLLLGLRLLNLPVATVLGTDFGWIENIPLLLSMVAIYPILQEIQRLLLPYLIIYIIVFIALLIALFRLWFVLLMAYINILIDVVLAPFWIVGSLVPGSPVSATGWLRDLIANLAAFPAVIFMFLLGKVFVDGFSSDPNAFVPPLIGAIGGAKMFSSLIGIGVILMTPNVVTMVKAAIKAPKLDTGGIGRAIGVGASVPMGTARGVQQTMLGAREYRISGVQAGPGGQQQVQYGPVGIGRAFARRIFGG